MDKALTKVSIFWISKRAKKDISSMGDEITSFSNTVEGGEKWIFNNLKGKMQNPLPNLLPDYELPAGLFPKNDQLLFDEVSAKLNVYIPSICEVGLKNSSVVRYATRVTGFLLRRKLTGIEGMKTKVVIQVKATIISVDGP
eukprot:Gb_30998 [translate_table: standard]